MLTGEVKLLKKVKTISVSFASLEKGEGVVSKTGTRIKIGPGHYLHFTGSGVIQLNLSTEWNPENDGKIRNFRLIAEEI
ncbi:hypothetical protein LCGC14_1564130 [marine sediment metagenome]|uniref:Uncharacterized protein n=1 Tax=marine sediment metagenome TaxID=412755 RepID=A0A0F9ILL1_9ZZZZ